MYCEHCPHCNEARARSVLAPILLGAEVIRKRHNREVEIVVFNMVNSGYRKTAIAKGRHVSPPVISIKYARGKKTSELRARQSFNAQPSDLFLLPMLKNIVSDVSI